MALPQPPIRLSYADAVCRGGLTIERTPEGVRIEFPRRFLASVWGAFAVIFAIGSILLLLLQLQSSFWILTKVYQVKYVSHSGKLVIRCQGEEMIELCPVRDPIVLGQVAEVLREAMEPGATPPDAGKS